MEINKINNELIKKVLNISLERDVEFDSLSLSKMQIPNSLSFLDDLKYSKEIFLNEYIRGVLINKEIFNELVPDNKTFILVEDPRYAYYTLSNYIAKSNYRTFPSRVSPKAIIHAKAVISDTNVIIKDNSIIGAGAIINSDVEIGENCIIQSGTVIGSIGFEYKRTKKGILSVFHDGKVIIGNNVEIGANNCIDKGFSQRHTIIEDDVKIDNLIHIAHSVLIKKGAFIIASSLLAGSSEIGEGAFIGPNATVGHIKVGDHGFVTMGAVVTKDVPSHQKVTGNFAIPHDKFLLNFKKQITSAK